MNIPKNINEEDWSYLCNLQKNIKGRICNNKKNGIGLNHKEKKQIEEEEEETKYIKKITNIIRDNKFVH